MASVQLAAYQGRTAKLTVVESSYSITDNTSTLTWTLEVLGGSSNYYNMYNLQAIVNGTTVYGPTTKDWSTKTFPAARGTKTGTVTINHNPDGSHADVGFTLKGKVFNSGTETYNGTVSLTTIPRASTVSIASSVTTNSAYTITVTPAVTNTFTHTLKYSIGSASGTIASLNASTTTYSWTIPRSLAAQIPNSTESSAGALVITCETYNGSTLVGSKTCSSKLVVDSGLIPTLSSSSIQDGNSTVRGKNWGVYLQNMSYVNINTMTGTGIQGSSISSYWCTFEGTNYSSTTLAGLNSQIQAKGLPTTGSRTLYLWVVDSRGRESTKSSKSYTVVAYSSPSINSYDAYRSNSSGSAIDDGTYFRYALNCSISSCNNKNPFTVNIRWKVKGSSTDTGSSKIKNAVTTEASYNSGGTLGGGNIGINNTYEIIFEVSDAFSTITRSRDISPAFELIHYHASGYAVAFGKKSSAGSNQKLFEVGMPATFHDVTKFYNLINSIQEGTGVNGPTKIRYIGNAEYNNLPNGSTDTETCCKALLKWICNTYPNDAGVMYIFTYTPNAAGMCFVHIYSNSIKDSTTGLPQYSTGIYFGLYMTDVHFGTYNYGWMYKGFDANNVALKDVNNNFTASQVINGRLFGTAGFMSNEDTNSINSPTQQEGLVIKKASSTYAPNNGVVLEYGPYSGWCGQLYIGDNADQGVWYNGWSNGVRGNWRKLAYQYELPTLTNGDITFTKSSGNGNMLSGKWWKFGNVIYLEIVFKTNGGSTSVGSNIWHGTVSGFTLPFYRATGSGYYSGGHYIAGLYGQYNYDGGTNSESGRLDIRALGQTIQSNSDAHSLSITYIIP